MIYFDRFVCSRLRVQITFFVSSGEQNFFTSAMIKDCMKKVVAVNLHQVIQVISFTCQLNNGIKNMSAGIHILHH